MDFSNELIELLSGTLIKGVLAAGVIWVLKILVSELIKRYFKMQDEKNREFKQFNDQLKNIVADIKMLINKLGHFKEMDEEYKSQIEDRFVQTALHNKEKIEDLKGDIAEVEVVNKERYNELKGKMSKMWASINESKERLDKIVTEHEMHHNKK